MNARLLVAAVILVPAVARPASYYVNDGSQVGDVLFDCSSPMAVGTDSGGCGGSCATPCATPEYAYQNLPFQPGDVLYVNAGTYTVGTCTANCPPLLDLSLPAKAGLANSPLTIQGAVDANGAPLSILNGGGLASAGIVVGTSWVTVDSLSVQSPGCPGTKSPFGSGVLVVGTPAVVGIVLSNLDISGTTCVDSAPIDFETAATPCTGCRIVGCRIHNNEPAGGIWIDGAGSVEVRNNEIFSNALTSKGLASMNIRASASPAIAGNRVHDNGGDALSLSVCAVGGGGCTAGTSTTNAFVHNNTFWNNQQITPNGEEVRIELGSTGTIFKNNIVGAFKVLAITVDSASAVGFVSDYNDFFLSGAKLGSYAATPVANLAAWQTASGQDSDSLSTDPLFVLAAPGTPPALVDVHLVSSAGRPGPGGLVADSATSPLIDSGDPTTLIGAEPAPNGGRVNLGAYGATAQGSMTPINLLIAGGSGQTGLPGQALPLPLTVLVADRGDAGYTERGVGIQFSTVSGGGSVSPAAPATVSTNDGGNAAAAATLGALGLNTYQAAVVNVFNVSPVTFQETAAGSLPDAGPDAGSADSGPADAAVADAGASDAAASDAGIADAGVADSGGVMDAGDDSGAMTDAAAVADGGVLADATTVADATAADGAPLADSGSADGAGPIDLPLNVGCGCGATESADWPVAIGLGGLLLSRRRRRRRC